MNARQRRLQAELAKARREQSGAYDQSNERRGEESRVTFLLARLGCPRKKYDLLRVAKERTGRPFLSLDLFNEMVPNFPLLMGLAPAAKVHKLHLDSRCTLPALTKHFQEAPFVKAYEEFYEAAEPRAAGRAVTLLFPRKGVPRGYALHNGEGLAGYWIPGSFFGCVGGTREYPTQLVAHSFAVLVDAIRARGNGWKPEFAF